MTRHVRENKIIIILFSSRHVSLSATYQQIEQAHEKLRFFVNYSPCPLRAAGIVCFS